jgi:RNA polymerase sigma-70 factor (ECF subfamily)
VVDDLTVLAHGAVDGDDAALAELVRRSQRTVEAVCRLLADADEVDDVVQEVYLRVVTALPRYRFDAPVLPWMLVIARRTCADVVRRHRRRRLVFDRWSTQRGPGEVPGPAGDVADLLGGLAAERRAAFVLTQLYGLSYEEAAAACGCPVGTVRSRVARARAELAVTLRKADSA